MKTVTLFFILFVALSSSSHAQTNIWHNYYIKYGLTSFCNNDNYIWFTETNQLVKFEKSTGYFSYQTIPDNILPRLSYHDSVIARVVGIVSDYSGNLWLSTEFVNTTYGFPKPDGVLYRFDGANWVNFSSILTAQGLEANLLPSFDYQNNMWFESSTKGLVKYDGSSFTFWNTGNSSLPSLSFTSRLIPDSSGNIWAILENAEVMKFDGNNFSVYNSAAMGTGLDSLGTCLAHISVNPVNDNVFVTLGCNSADQGYYQFNGTTWAHEFPDSNYSSSPFSGPIFFDVYGNNYLCLPAGIIEQNATSQTLISNLPNQQSGNSISNATYDVNGNMWFILNSTLVEFNGLNFTVYTDPRAVLESNIMQPEVIDKNGNIWLGYQEASGLTEITGNSFIPIIADSILAPAQHPITCLAVDTLNRIWYSGGVHYVDRGAITDISNVVSSGFYNVEGIAVDKNNNAWVIADGGFGIVVNNTLSPIPVYGTTTLTCITTDLKGNVWIGDAGIGLIEFNGNSFTYYDIYNSGLPSDSIEYVAVDSLNNLWVGTYDSGFAIFDGSGWTTYNTLNSQLPYNHVEWFYFYKGKKYVSTQKGFVIIDSSNWTVYTAVNSPLTDEDCESVVVDNQCNIWIATESGLSELEGDCNNAPSIIYGKATKQDGTTLANTQVYLMKLDATSGALKPIDNTATDVDGNFIFSTKEPEVYIHAEPNEIAYPGAMPGYEDSALVQQLSPAIQPTSQYTERNIKCMSASNINGNIILKGTVAKEGGGDAAALRLFLMQNNIPVATTLTSLNGGFEFDELSAGNYTIWADKMTINDSIAPALSLKADSSIFASLLLHPTYLELLATGPITTGITGTKENATFLLYPNPGTGDFNILFHSDINRNIAVQLFDMNGRMVLSAVLNNGTNQLNLEQLSNGVYFLRAETTNEVIRRKIVIQR